MLTVFESELFTPEEIEAMIDYNRSLVSKRGEGFDVERDIFYSIFERLDNYNSIADDNARILKKSAHLLGGITHAQPFNEGNKEMALSITRSFLRRNRKDMSLDTKQKKIELYDLLQQTIQKFPGEDKLSDIEAFLVRIVMDLPT